MDRKAYSLAVPMKHYRQQLGFTLVELMVVVAVIGILSAISISNFKAYLAKAKSAEAKIMLASIYTAETHALAEGDTYVGCLENIGIVQPQRGYYTSGFMYGTWVQNSIYKTNTHTRCGSESWLAPVVCVAPQGCISAYLPAGTQVSADSFVVGSGGYVGNSANPDGWTIDQNKNLVHVNSFGPGT